MELLFYDAVLLLVGLGTLSSVHLHWTSALVVVIVHALQRRYLSQSHRLVLHLTAQSEIMTSPSPLRYQVIRIYKGVCLSPALTQTAGQY